MCDGVSRFRCAHQSRNTIWIAAAMGIASSAPRIPRSEAPAKRSRVDAREQLRTAFEMFNAMAIEAFAGRSERELLASGERVRTHSRDAG